MRLFLASDELDAGDRADDSLLAALIGLGPDRPRTAIVLNGRDGDPNTDRVKAFARERASLGRLGDAAIELDLRSFAGDPPGLAVALDRLELLWLTGGSAHALRAAMTASGFPELIRERVASDRLVYAGYSAGACAAGPPLYGERLRARPRRAGEQPLWGDLGLVGFSIVPHHPLPGTAATDLARIAAHLRGIGRPCETLSDGEAIVVHGARIARLPGPPVAGAPA